MRVKPNDELRHEWRQSLQQKRGLARSTIDAKLAALTVFEEFTSRQPFAKIHRQQVAAFKEHLLTERRSKTGERLSTSTIVHLLEHCGDFFRWLETTEDGPCLDREAVTWFRPSRADKERSRATSPKPVPHLDDARAAFAAMPAKTLIDRRNRAVFATLLLTAIRADALASLTIGTVDIATGSIRQDARIVRTKFARSFTTFFFPFAAEALPVLESWVSELLELGLSPDDALFPRDIELQRLANGERALRGACPCWSGSTQVRAIVRGAFRAAGLDPHAPHVFRHMLARHATSLRPTAEELLALSINLGHKKIETTLDSYARPDDERRRELIANLGRSSRLQSSDQTTNLIKHLSRNCPDLAERVIEELNHLLANGHERSRD